MTQPASITDAFLPLVPEIAEADIPMFIAMLERVAASHYELWAEAAADPIETAGLLACAAREIEISEFIESLYPDAQATIDGLNQQFPDLAARYGAIMEGRPRAEQLRIQSEGELGGSSFMLQFAEANDGVVAARFQSLASCEEANSKFLAGLVA